jgi:hypothetical protein
MDTHIQGPVSTTVSGSGTDVGSVVSQRAFPLALTDNGTAKYLCTVEGATNLPVFVEIDAFVETAFNGSSNNLYSVYPSSGSYYVTTAANSSVGFKAGATATRAIVRARTPIYALLNTGTQATGTFTPPTSSTATCVINGVSFTATFSSNATTTVTNLKALIAANAVISALVTTSGTTTLILTAVQAGTAGNAITTTSNAANGASFAAATLTGGANATTGAMSVIVRATGFGSGTRITV